MEKVSIIIPCFNKEAYIKEAVESALNQTYPNKEIVCIDDASTDNSYEILKGLVDKYKNIVLLRNEENKGVVYSRNTAIEASTGDYVLPLDGDDTIEPTYVEKAIKIFDERPEVGVVYTKYKYVGASKRKIELPEVSKEYLLYSSCISSCSMFRKSDFTRVGKYKNEMQHGCEDWELWLSFYEQGFKFYLIDEYLLNYRRTKNVTRTNNAGKNILDIKRQLIKKHINLYLSDEDFIDKVFVTSNTQKKYIKYKKLFNRLIIFDIVLVVLLIILILR